MASISPFNGVGFALGAAIAQTIRTFAGASPVCCVALRVSERVRSDELARYGQVQGGNLRSCIVSKQLGIYAWRGCLILPPER